MNNEISQERLREVYDAVQEYVTASRLCDAAIQQKGYDGVGIVQDVMRTENAHTHLFELFPEEE
jgi:hypothetical protein